MFGSIAVLRINGPGIRLIVKAGDANRRAVGGRPVKEEFVAILPAVALLCEAVPQWPELEYFAGWIADKTSDPYTATKHYQRALDQSDRVKSPDLVNYLNSHIAQLNAAAVAAASPAAVAAGSTGWSPGAVIKDANEALKRQGVVEEAVWPYEAGKFGDKPPAAVATAARWQITDARRLNGLDEIKSALASDGPVVAGIEVYQEAMSAQTAKPGVFKLPLSTSQPVGEHAIVLIAYDVQKKQFKFANDWGSAWGDGGYGYLSEQYIKDHSSDCWSFKGVSRAAQT